MDYDYAAAQYGTVLPDTQTLGDPLALMLSLERAAEQVADRMNVSSDLRPAFVRIWRDKQYDNLTNTY